MKKKKKIPGEDEAVTSTTVSVIDGEDEAHTDTAVSVIDHKNGEVSKMETGDAEIEMIKVEPKAKVGGEEVEEHQGAAPELALEAHIIRITAPVPKSQELLSKMNQYLNSYGFVINNDGIFTKNQSMLDSQRDVKEFDVELYANQKKLIIVLTVHMVLLGGLSTMQSNSYHKKWVFIILEFCSAPLLTVATSTMFGQCHQNSLRLKQKCGRLFETVKKKRNKLSVVPAYYEEADVDFQDLVDEACATLGKNWKSISGIMSQLVILSWTLSLLISFIYFSTLCYELLSAIHFPP